MKGGDGNDKEQVGLDSLGYGQDGRKSNIETTMKRMALVPTLTRLLRCCSLTLKFVIYNKIESILGWYWC